MRIDGVVTQALAQPLTTGPSTCHNIVVILPRGPAIGACASADH
jgi:hypothetical protein